MITHLPYMYYTMQGRNSHVILTRWHNHILYLPHHNKRVKFILGQMYISIAVAIGDNTAYLHRTNKQFRKLLKEAKNLHPPTRTSTFAQLASAQQKHSCPKGHCINTTLREELRVFVRALQFWRMNFRTLIAHLVRRNSSAQAWSNSSLRATGGYSIAMGFWWYLKWPKLIHNCTLIDVRNKVDDYLISINVLEYIALLITYAGTI